MSWEEEWNDLPPLGVMLFLKRLVSEEEAEVDGGRTGGFDEGRFVDSDGRMIDVVDGRGACTRDRLESTGSWWRASRSSSTSFVVVVVVVGVFFLTVRSNIGGVDVPRDLISDAFCKLHLFRNAWVAGAWSCTVEILKLWFQWISRAAYVAIREMLIRNLVPLVASDGKKVVYHMKKGHDFILCVGCGSALALLLLLLLLPLTGGLLRRSTLKLLRWRRPTRRRHNRQSRMRRFDFAMLETRWMTTDGGFTRHDANKRG